MRRRGGINVSPIGTEAGTDNDVRDNDVGSNLLLASWRDESCIAFFILPAAHSERMGLRFCQVSGLSSGFRGAFCTHLLLRVLTHSLSHTHTHTYTQTHTHRSCFEFLHTHTHTHTHVQIIYTFERAAQAKSKALSPQERAYSVCVVGRCVYVCLCVHVRARACARVFRRNRLTFQAPTHLGACPCNRPCNRPEPWSMVCWGTALRARRAQRAPP